MNQEINGIMVLKNAVKLPDSHTWVVDSDSPIVNSSSTKESVPLIDLDDPQALEKIKMACENWGVFQVTNHGVPVALLAQIQHQTRRFFELAPEQKLRVMRSPGSPAGYGPPRISQFFSSRMWHEGFTVAGSPLEHARRVWPQDYSAFCAVIEDYQEQMMGLVGKIVALMFKSLGLSAGEDVEWFESNGPCKNAQTYLQLNSYPNCPDPTRAMGLAQHTDTSLITLLYQSGTSRGLQVYGPNRNWVDVEPISNAIVVNLGDLMQIFSNDCSKACYIEPFAVNFPCLDIKNKYFNALEMIGFNSVVEKSNALASGNEAPLGSEHEYSISSASIDVMSSSDPRELRKWKRAGRRHAETAILEMCGGVNCVQISSNKLPQKSQLRKSPRDQSHQQEYEKSLKSLWLGKLLEDLDIYSNYATISNAIIP
nr:gibberellin 3-beta-dioxygenase 3-like [Ipomoea batatas]